MSASPRRREILAAAGYLFRSDTDKISESIEENVNLTDAISAVARDKGQAYINAYNHLISQDILLVSADTVVVLAGVPLGKPKNATQAADFLSRLSGKTHSVTTGIYLKNLQSGEEVLTADNTLVEFRELDESEIAAYVEGGECFDKAGAYAIQGDGGRFVTRIEGSRFNVIGFPLELFKKILAEKNWHVEKKS